MVLNTQKIQAFISAGEKVKTTSCPKRKENGREGPKHLF